MMKKVIKSSDIEMFHPAWVKINNGVMEIWGSQWYYGDSWNVSKPFSIYVPHYTNIGLKHIQEWGGVITENPYDEDWKSYKFPMHEDTGHNFPDPEYYIVELDFKTMIWKLTYCYPKPIISDIQKVFLKGTIVGKPIITPESIIFKGELITDGRYLPEGNQLKFATYPEAVCDVRAYLIEFTATRALAEDIKSQVSPEGAYIINKPVVLKVVTKN